MKDFVVEIAIKDGAGNVIDTFSRWIGVDEVKSTADSVSCVFHSEWGDRTYSTATLNEGTVLSREYDELSDISNPIGEHVGRAILEHVHEPSDLIQLAAVADE